MACRRVNECSSKIEVRCTSSTPAKVNSDINLYWDGAFLLWDDSLDKLKRFVDVQLLLKGKWTSPGGEVKLFTDKDSNFALKWLGKNKKKLIVTGDDTSSVDNKMRKLAKFLQTNERMSDLNVYEGREDELDKMSIPMEMVEMVDSQIIDYTLEGSKILDNVDNENSEIVIDNDCLEKSSSDENDYSISRCRCDCDETQSHIKQIARNLKRLEDRLDASDKSKSLEKENKDLQKDLNEANIIINQLRARVVSLEEEKSSLLTAIKIIRIDEQKQSDGVCEDKDANVNPWIEVVNKNKENQKSCNRSSSSPQRNAVIQNNKSKSQTLDKAKAKEQTQKPKPKKTVIIGDSMVKGLHAAKIGKTTGDYVVVKSFSGSTAADMKHYVKPQLSGNPSNVIIHVGTNNLKTCEADEIIEEIGEVCDVIKQSNSSINITISEIIDREDDKVLKSKIKEVNVNMARYCEQKNLCLLKHANIDKRGLNRQGLHLNRAGTAILAKNIINHIKLINHV